MTNHEHPQLDSLCASLCERFQVHTILLYGSHANGTNGPDSDIDLAAFGPLERVIRDARVVGNTYLDAFVYPERELSCATEEHLKLRGSKIIMQREDQATKFLAEVEKVYAAGPTPFPPDELAVRKAWAYKMCARIQRGDIEGNFRRAWLLTALLEDYFHLRGRWYEGPKRSFQWLGTHDPATRNAFEQALSSGASLETIRRLVKAVVGEDQKQ